MPGVAINFINRFVGIMPVTLTILLSYIEMLQIKIEMQQREKLLLKLQAHIANESHFPPCPH